MDSSYLSILLSILPDWIIGIVSKVFSHFNKNNIEILKFSINGKDHKKRGHGFYIKDDFYTNKYDTPSYPDPFPYWELTLRNNKDKAILLDHIDIEILSYQNNYRPIVNIDTITDEYNDIDDDVSTMVNKLGSKTLTVCVTNNSITKRDLVIKKICLSNQDNGNICCIYKKDLFISKDDNLYKITIDPSVIDGYNEIGYIDISIEFDYLDDVNKPIKEVISYEPGLKCIFYNKNRGFYTVLGFLGDTSLSNISSIKIDNIYLNLDERSTRYQLGNNYKILTGDIMNLRFRFIPNCPCILKVKISINSSGLGNDIEETIEYNFVSNNPNDYYG